MSDKQALDAAREAAVRGPILEQVRELFTEQPTLQSAWLMVSQYWSDEAEDAVHGLLLFSKLPEPSLEGFRADEAWLDDDDDWEAKAALAAAGEAPLSDNLRGMVFDDEGSEFDLWGLGTVYAADWDDNGDAIPLFAAWCAEGSDQEMPRSEAYRPIVLYQRAGDDVTARWIAEPLRPWLDGVQPVEADDDL
jgi:hypothetical protein